MRKITLLAFLLFGCGDQVRNNYEIADEEGRKKVCVGGYVRLCSEGDCVDDYDDRGRRVRCTMTEVER